MNDRDRVLIYFCTGLGCEGNVLYTLTQTCGLLPPSFPTLHCISVFLSHIATRFNGIKEWRLSLPNPAYYMYECTIMLTLEEFPATLLYNFKFERGNFSVETQSIICQETKHYDTANELKCDLYKFLDMLKK